MAVAYASLDCAATLLMSPVQMLPAAAAERAHAASEERAKHTHSHTPESATVRAALCYEVITMEKIASLTRTHTHTHNTFCLAPCCCCCCVVVVVIILMRIVFMFYVQPSPPKKQKKSD